MRHPRLAEIYVPVGDERAKPVNLLRDNHPGLGAISRRPRVRRRNVRIAGLPPELDGYRIGQISDVHCGPHTPATRVRRWVDRLNALDVDLMTVTGDLITSGSSHTSDVAVRFQEHVMPFFSRTLSFAPVRR